MSRVLTTKWAVRCDHCGTEHHFTAHSDELPTPDQLRTEGWHITSGSGFDFCPECLKDGDAA